MRIGIVGWGLEGQSAYHYFGPQHDYLIVNEEPRDDFPPQSDKVRVHFLENPAPTGIAGQAQDLSYLEGINKCDKIIYQPTAYFNLQKFFGNNSDFWSRATTVYDIFFENSPTQKIIGVTGSKGKGTSSTLIAKILDVAGMKTHLGGNIGTPILDLLPDIKPDDWVVWELANFQLKPASHSPHVAVCLMVTKEHLDWHPSFEDYLQAKANLFRHQTADDIAIYFSKNQYSEQIAGHSPGHKIPYFAAPGARVREDGMIVVGESETEIIRTDQLKLIGKHNWQNVCAAVTCVYQISQNLEPMKQVLATFTGLEHRLEFVRELNHISYYDDSFGTTPDTAIVALRAFAQPAVLIVGGWDKGLPFDDLIAEIAQKDRVRHVIAIGQTGHKIAQMLKAKNFTAITEGLEKMPDIVAEARARAQPGDVVLLSCATSSFGLFHDYKDRGDQFKQAVTDLE